MSSSSGANRDLIFGDSFGNRSYISTIACSEPHCPFSPSTAHKYQTINHGSAYATFVDIGFSFTVRQKWISGDAPSNLLSMISSLFDVRAFPCQKTTSRAPSGIDGCALYWTWMGAVISWCTSFTVVIMLQNGWKPLADPLESITNGGLFCDTQHLRVLPYH